ncbi:MAG: DUF1850 domain-containing protein [Tissierellia bacterium]|jgi:hypothetical protein|nr:DUF1850 domain-containing protein [Tissierellia bacterium]
MMSRESNNTKSYGKGYPAFPAFLIILILIIVGLLIPVRMLIASDNMSDNPLKIWLIPVRDNFTVAHTHSVELTEVKDIYQIEGTDIILTETIFSSYGAGLPATTDYPFEITDQGFRIYDINQTIDPLVYRTGAVRANHRLILGDKEITFLDFSQPAQGVRLRTKMMPLIYYLTKEVFQ